MKNTKILECLVDLVKRFCDIVYHEVGCNKCPFGDGDQCGIKCPNWRD